MGAENFLEQLMENFNEENAAYVTVADVDEFGNVVFSNSVVENADDIPVETEPLEEGQA
jgi:hypothetical protein